jgi:hypothetical protein
LSISGSSTKGPFFTLLAMISAVSRWPLTVGWLLAVANGQ